jgi:hypothetical protein
MLGFGLVVMALVCIVAVFAIVSMVAVYAISTEK